MGEDDQFILSVSLRENNFSTLVLCLFCAVESNDIALLNDGEFHRTIKELGALVIEKILQVLEELGISKVFLQFLIFCFTFSLEILFEYYSNFVPQSVTHLPVSNCQVLRLAALIVDLIRES